MFLLYTCMYHSTHVEVREHFAGVCSLLSTIWVPGIKFRSLGFETNAFNGWVISLAPFLLEKAYFLFYICTCVCVCGGYMYNVSAGILKVQGCGFSWSWSYRQLWATWQGGVRRPKVSSVVRAVHAGHHWAISLALYLSPDFILFFLHLSVCNFDHFVGLQQVIIIVSSTHAGHCLDYSFNSSLLADTNFPRQASCQQWQTSSPGVYLMSTGLVASHLLPWQPCVSRALLCLLTHAHRLFIILAHRMQPWVTPSFRSPGWPDKPRAISRDFSTRPCVFLKSPCTC